MQENDDEPTQKHPTEMTTDEALDYLFAPEIAEQLRREAGMCEPAEEPESTD
jgi:hypothetical protein